MWGGSFGEKREGRVKGIANPGLDFFTIPETEGLFSPHLGPDLRT